MRRDPAGMKRPWWPTLVSRVWGTLSEATILTWQMLRDVNFIYIKAILAEATYYVFLIPTILIRGLYFSCEYIVHLILVVSAKWEGAFAISCIAVSLDPLFFYIPIIDETKKCLKLDRELRTTAVVLRLLTDIPLTIHFVALLWGKDHTDHPNLSDSDSDHSNSDFNSDSDDSSDFEYEKATCSLKSVRSATARRMSWLSVPVLINFLAVLPIPQVVILIGFFRLRSSSGMVIFLQRTFLNVSLVLQYLPRVCQIYLSSQHFRMGGIWIKPSLYLFLYIIAGHVFAAFWYFFGIERETSCWHQACRNTPGCVSNFYCGAIEKSPMNLTTLSQLCPINSPNTTVFDFGIYLPLLQSGNTGAVNFFSKLFYSLWWGLRNLSNFGTNLETSSYMWENCFAILICISGLLLFLCLIGNVQKYMELATTKSLKSEESRRNKIAEKKKQIKTWMSRNDVSLMLRDGCRVNMRKRIMKYIKQHRIVQKDIKADVDVKYFLANNLFPLYRIREPLKEYLVKSAANSVLVLKKMDEDGWSSLCKYMEPVIYVEKENIVEKSGQELVEMIFIIQGEIECTNTMVTHPHHLKKGDCYDIRLQNWALMNYHKSYYDPRPTSTGRVRCQTKVEAFAVRASDLLDFFRQNFIHLHLTSEQLEKLAVGYHNITHHQTNNQDDDHDQHLMKPWKRPERGLVKLNIAVVWDSDSKLAKMGCVCRNSHGKFIVAGNSSTASQLDDAFLADAWGMAKAIEFSHQKLTLQIGIGMVVESDNQDLIDCLNRPFGPNQRISATLLPVLEDIFKFASNFKPRTFMYCSPQSNRVASFLANQSTLDHAGNSDDVLAFCEAPPAWLVSKLKDDTDHDEELGISRNDSMVISPDDDARHDDEEFYVRLAEDSQH